MVLHKKERTSHPSHPSGKPTNRKLLLRLLFSRSSILKLFDFGLGGWGSFSRALLASSRKPSLASTSPIRVVISASLLSTAVVARWMMLSFSSCFSDVSLRLQEYMCHTIQLMLITLHFIH